MKQEEKELLLKDLCARSPYGVKIFVNDNVEILEGVHILDKVASYAGWCASDIEEVKPYLFPLSSMTEEQRKEYHELLCNPENGIDIDYFDWCHQNHFDCRHLIPMGLAIDATGLNIY
jgi:hypothetical protein